MESFFCELPMKDLNLNMLKTLHRVCDFFPPTGPKDLEQFNSRKSCMEISQGILFDNIFAANSKTSVKAL